MSVAQRGLSGMVVGLVTEALKSPRLAYVSKANAEGSASRWLCGRGGR